MCDWSYIFIHVQKNKNNPPTHDRTQQTVQVTVSTTQSQTKLRISLDIFTFVSLDSDLILKQDMTSDSSPHGPHIVSLARVSVESQILAPLRNLLRGVPKMPGRHRLPMGENGNEELRYSGGPWD